MKRGLTGLKEGALFRGALHLLLPNEISTCHPLLLTVHCSLLTTRKWQGNSPLLLILLFPLFAFS